MTQEDDDTSTQAALERVGQRLERWRTRHGGRGIRIPDGFWGEAVELAGALGAATVARALRLDAKRLERQMTMVPAITAVAAESFEFVEVDGARLCTPGRTVLWLMGRDGERLQIDIDGSPAVDVLAVTRAFWERTA